MDYRQELKKMQRNRGKYFPVIDGLLAIKECGGSSPVHLDDPERMRTVLELIDIGYLDADAFIVNKKFGEINRIYFKGGNPLTPAGWKEYRRNYVAGRMAVLKRLSVFLLMLLLCAVVFIIKFC